MVEAIAIRAAAEADAAALSALRLAALRDHPEAFSAAYETHADKPAEFWIDWLRDRGDGQAGTIQVAAAGDTLVGMTGLQRGRPPKGHHSGIIWGVYVRPDWRGLRLAGRLIDACLDWAGTRGVRIVKLAVVVSNTTAIRSYARCGFTVYGIEPMSIHHDGVYHDQLLMARRIG